MRVMMLLKSDAQSEAGVPADEQMLSDMGVYAEALINAGVLLGGEGLHPSGKGAKVRISKGKTTVIDGPFAEAKDVVAGYFMLETQDLAEAIEWTKKLPGAEHTPEHEAELRPLYELEEFGVGPENAASRELPVSSPDKGARWIHFIKADKHTEAEKLPTDELLQELLQKMGALMDEMQAKGVLISADGLRPTKDGAKVRIKNKKITVLDGPFSEAKEVIAGFTLFRAKTKAEATEWARRCLQIHMDVMGIDTGEIEVRPVYETEER